MRVPHSNPLDDPHYRAAASRVLLIFLLAAAFVLAGRLFHLQVILGGYHKSLSEQIRPVGGCARSKPVCDCPIDIRRFTEIEKADFVWVRGCHCECEISDST